MTRKGWKGYLRLIKQLFGSEAYTLDFRAWDYDCDKAQLIYIRVIRHGSLYMLLHWMFSDCWNDVDWNLVDISESGFKEMWRSYFEEGADELIYFGKRNERS
jgi:hypothetical protein